MEKRPQRTVEAAVFEGIGPVSAQSLLELPESSWGHLRDRITDFRQSGKGLIARCMACDGDVYIRTAPHRGKNLPLFSHYRGNPTDCPWHHEYGPSSEVARADQYRGRQESKFHRLVCEQVAALVALDPRHVRHTVSEYLAPTESAYGRFPDIYVEWAGYGAFAIEFQFSGTFQTEISARCMHYQREGVPLLWILFGIETTGSVPQSFRDVIRRHRGNAFVLDPTAIQASKDQSTLVLSCYLQSADGFDPPRLVRFDSLTVPKSRIPYLEDRVAAPLLDAAEQRRGPWRASLEKWNHDSSLLGLDRPEALLLAAAFSIVDTANGQERNYASKHPNIRAMLNTYLHGGNFGRYTQVLTQLIRNTAVKGLLQTSVGEHLLRHQRDHQVDDQSPEWLMLKQLFPEALDPVIRDELRHLEALPKWART